MRRVVILGAGLALGVALAGALAGQSHGVCIGPIEDRVATMRPAIAQAESFDSWLIYQRDLVQTPIDTAVSHQKRAFWPVSAPFLCILGPSPPPAPAGNARPPTFS